MEILVTGGGTGGHIHPALVFVNYVKTQEPNAEFMHAGAKQGLENKIVPGTRMPFHTLEIQGFKRKISAYSIKAARLFLKSIRQAEKILSDFQSDIVIGTGGYISGAVAYAAAKMGTPTVIHEQNSVPGVTNKFLSRYVDRIAFSFKDAASFFPENRAVPVGNPRAQEVVDAEKSDTLRTPDLGPEKKAVLIFGGSQGVLRINQAVSVFLSKYIPSSYQVLHASGDRHYEEILNKINPEMQNTSVQPYIKNMAEVTASSDLLVGCTGATLIAEFTALESPAVLVPSPYVMNDHQIKNIMSLVYVGAVKMIADNELTGESLSQTISKIMGDEELQKQMCRVSKEQGIPDTLKRFYDLVKQIIKKQRWWS